MEITNEPVRIDYDLMEVVPADHFEARVENGDRVYGASEVRQKLVDVIEKSKRELLRNWPNIQSALSPEEPVAVPVVVGGE